MTDKAKPTTPTASNPVQSSNSTAQDGNGPLAVARRFGQQLRDAWNGSNEEKKPPEPPADATTTTTNFRQARSGQKGPSPVQKQHRDPRFQPDYQPISITFLTGRYQGEQLDLGLSPNEVSNEQSGDWNDQDGMNIRVGATFDKLTPRTFSLKLTYFCLNADVSHLIENCYCLQEMGDGERTPPFLLYKQGAITASPVVCTGISSSYSDPLPGSGGYRKGEVDLSLKLIGGVTSEHALGKPLAPTPLNDARSRRTQEEQAKIGAIARVEQRLAPCLKSKEGSDKLEDLIRRDKLNDVNAILQLPSDVFVQAAVGGMFPKSVLKDDRIRQKLRSDLAAEIATAQEGIGAVGTESPRRFARAILTGDVSGLTNNLAGAARQARSDYDRILKAILDQDLGVNSDFFTKDENNLAADRLRRMAGCGLELRNLGAPTVAEPQGDVKKQLDEINQLLGEMRGRVGGLTQEDKKTLEERFGITTDAQRRSLLNGSPYSSQDEFIQHASRSTTAGITGHVLWQNYTNYRKQQEEKDKDKGT